MLSKLVVNSARIWKGYQGRAKYALADEKASVRKTNRNTMYRTHLGFRAFFTSLFGSVQSEKRTIPLVSNFDKSTRAKNASILVGKTDTFNLDTLFSKNMEQNAGKMFSFPFHLFAKVDFLKVMKKEDVFNVKIARVFLVTDQQTGDIIFDDSKMARLAVGGKSDGSGKSDDIPEPDRDVLIQLYLDDVPVAFVSRQLEPRDSL